MPPFSFHTDSPEPTDFGSAFWIPPQLRCRSRDHRELVTRPLDASLLWCQGCLTRICRTCSTPSAPSDAFLHRWNKVCPHDADEWRLSYPEGKSNCICDWDEIMGLRCVVCQEKRGEEVIAQISRSRGGQTQKINKWCTCLRVVETKQQWREGKRKVAYCGVCHEWAVEAPEGDVSVNTLGAQSGLTSSDQPQMQQEVSEGIQTDPTEPQSPIWEDFEDEEEEEDASMSSLGMRTNPMGPEPPSSDDGEEEEVF